MTENAQESDPTGSDVATTTPIGAVSVRDTTAAVELVKRLSNKASVQAETADSRELMMGALTDIANATSEADLFEANEGGGTPSLRDNLHLIGVPLNVYEIGFITSSDEYAESGLGTFVIVHALTDKGDELLFNTGASNVVATLMRAEEMNLISPDKPWRIVISAKKTANGTLFKVTQPRV